MTGWQVFGCLGGGALSKARFHPLLCVQLICAFGWVTPAHATAIDDDGAPAARRIEAMNAFKDQVTPFITMYCAQCHGVNRQKGGVTFASPLKNPGSPSFRAVWKRAVAQIKTHDMPPEDEDKQPSEAERKAILDGIGAMKYLSPKGPGPFVIRRL